MSGLTQQEIMDKHIQCLKEGRDACQSLAKNADPEYIFPRGHLYGSLKRALKALEGTCRQMAAFRDDTRWTKLGFVYARAMRVAQVKFVRQDWLAFRQIAEIFEVGLKRMDELANAKTGKTGVILPKRTDWLVLPDLKTPTPQLWTPQGRAMN